VAWEGLGVVHFVDMMYQIIMQPTTRFLFSLPVGLGFQNLQE
jgi:hypothetical protein